MYWLLGEEEEGEQVGGFEVVVILFVYVVVFLRIRICSCSHGSP